jgi:nucleotide-binding universal stress UspA family protein
MIKTILVPTDGSAHANKAVTLAADIAEKYKARLVLLHVLPRGPLPDALRHMAEVEHVLEGGAPGPAGATASIPTASIPTASFPAGIVSGKDGHDREVLEFVGRKILSNAEDIAKGKGITDCESALEDGNPVKRILDYADRENANLIVMGSRGVTDFNGLLMGSVSHTISHLAKCTCITVK